MSGPTLILISGWAHAPSAMDGLAAKLSADSVVSTSTNELWRRCQDTETTSPYVDGLASLIGRACARTIVVGWSMGGMVALEAAARHSGLMCGLVVISGTARFCSGDGYEAGVPVPHVRAMAQELKRNQRPTLSRFFEQVAEPLGESGMSLQDKVDAASSLDAGELGYGLAYLQRFDIRSCLARIGIPVLVVHGRKDRVVPWRAGRLLSAGLPDSRFLLDDEAGHAIPIQNPARLALEIGKFVGIIQESEPRRVFLNGV